MPLPNSVGLTGDKAKAAALLKKFFPNHTPQQIAGAAGMVLPHLRVNFFHAGDDLLGVEGQGVGETHLTRYFVPNTDKDGEPNGTYTLKHESQWVDPQQRGEGHERFAEQLQHLSKLPSVSRIHIHLAAGSAESNSWRQPRHQTAGYFAWPQFGFQGKLEQYHLDDLDPEIVKKLDGKPLDTHSLFAIEGGPEEWRKKGQQLTNLSFDLAPDSEHRKRFAAYYAKRNAKTSGTANPLGATAGTGTPPSGAGQTGAAGTDAPNRFATGEYAVRGIAQRLMYKQEQKFSTVLLPVQGELRQKVLELANKVPDRLLAGNGRETDPHLTLLYGLHSGDHRPVQDLFANAEGKIGFRLGKVSVFKNPDFDVLKVEVHSPDAHKANALLKTLPHTSTYPNYNPHLTLAYVKSGEGERLAKELGSVEGEGASDQLTFSDSERNHTPIQIGAAKYKQELAGGKWQGKSIRQALVSEGAKVEKEHTTDPKVAAEIAKDHLTEDRNYYPKLKVTERLTLADLKAALRRKKGSKMKYAKEKPTYSPLISHAAAVLDNPDLGAVGAFADHLVEVHPDHPLTQALHQWINGADAKDTLIPHLRDKTPHNIVGPWDAGAGSVKPVDMGVVPSDRYFIPEGHRAFQKFRGDDHWIEVIPMTEDNKFSRVPKSRRKVSSAEVAQHLFDTGGLPSLVYGVVGAQYWHPERQKEREAGTRSKALTFYKTEQVKYATEQPVAHPSVAGFQLEHALRRAISDPETTSELKALSHTLLTQGVNSAFSTKLMNDEVQLLPEDHWLKKAGYNWYGMEHKLHLDDAVGHAIAAVNRAWSPNGDPTHRGGRELLSHYTEHPDSETPAWGEAYPAAHSVAQEAADLLFKQKHSQEDILESLERHAQRKAYENGINRRVVTPEEVAEVSTQPKEGYDPNRYAAKGKNPEGGLTVAEARRQGIEPGSRTRAEAKKAGGFSKIEGKTQKRRKSFCARACGQAKQFPKAAKDPESRLRKALRIWGCRCGASKNSTSEEAVKYGEGSYSPLVSHAAAAMDNPTQGAIGSFADHLAEHYPDHPVTKGLLGWINGEPPQESLYPVINDTPHVGSRPFIAGSTRLNLHQRGNVEGLRTFGRNYGDPKWTETDQGNQPVKEGISSAEVAQHLLDTGGIGNVVSAIVSIQHFHPDRQKEVAQGKRPAYGPTFYKAVKYQSPALSDFITAVRQIRSSNQEVRRQIAEQQYRKLGLKAAVRDAIADAPHTASANTAQSVEHNGDLDKVRAAATLYAQQTGSPQLLLFHEHADGQDLLHKFDAEGSAEKLRQSLDQAGLTNRTLSPTPTGWSVFFFAPKGQLTNKLKQFTQQKGYTLESSRGTGERVGEGQAAEAGKEDRAGYRNFIDQYEKQQGIQ